MAKVIRENTPHDVGMIPAMKSDEAVRTILASLEAEAESEADKLFDAVAGGDLGAKALQTRGDRCDALMRKVSEYEKLLGVSATALNERLTELRGSLAAATMVATTDENATGVFAL